MEGQPESFSILVVCDGNVCRSPTAQFVLGTKLTGVVVESAGMHATSGTSFCTVAAEAVSGYGDQAIAFGSYFRPRSVRNVGLGDFGLILTATTEHRAEIARNHLDLRDRVFTLREASGLLSGLGELSEIGDSVGYSEVPALMNRYRGALSAPTTEVLRFGRTAVDPMDIPDAHHGRGRRHREMVALAASSAALIGDSLRTLAIR